MAKISGVRDALHCCLSTCDYMCKEAAVGECGWKKMSDILLKFSLSVPYWEVSVRPLGVPGLKGHAEQMQQ